MHKFVLGLAIMALSSCATNNDLQSNAAEVHVQKGGKIPDGCQKIKDIKSSQTKAMFGSNASVEEGAVNGLKNQTAEAGGNLTVMLHGNAKRTTGLNPLATDNITVLKLEGIAYKCPPLSLENIPIRLDAGSVAPAD